MTWTGISGYLVALSISICPTLFLNPAFVPHELHHHACRTNDQQTGKSPRVYKNFLKWWHMIWYCHMTHSNFVWHMASSHIMWYMSWCHEKPSYVLWPKVCHTFLYGLTHVMWHHNCVAWHMQRDTLPYGVICATWTFRFSVTHTMSHLPITLHDGCNHPNRCDTCFVTHPMLCDTWKGLQSSRCANSGVKRMPKQVLGSWHVW